VRHEIFADRALVITGAMIRATTAGRIPMNTLLNTGLFRIRSGVRNTAMVNMIRNEGIIVPSAAHRLPAPPRILSPTATEIFTARIPGIDCATAS